MGAKNATESLWPFSAYVMIRTNSRLARSLGDRFAMSTAALAARPSSGVVGSAFEEPPICEPSGRPKLRPAKVATRARSATNAMPHGNMDVWVGVVARFTGSAPDPTGVPHRWQNLAPAESALPHAAQNPAAGRLFWVVAPPFIESVMRAVSYRLDSPSVHTNIPCPFLLNRS